MNKLTTNLAAIRKAGPCPEGWEKLHNHLGKTAQEAKTDTAEFSLEVVLDRNGLDDALWVLDNVIKNRRIISLFSADCAERVHHLFAAVMPDDDGPMNAINVARDPSATDEDRVAARYALLPTAEVAARYAARASQKDRLRQYIQHGEAAADLAWG